MTNRNRPIYLLGALLLLVACAIYWLTTSGPSKLETAVDEFTQEQTTHITPKAVLQEQVVESRREAVEVEASEIVSTQPEPVAEEVVHPKVYFWGTTAIARWKDGQSRLELCFPILQVSATEPTSVKIWGVSRGQEPYLLAHSEFAYSGVTTVVTVYRREIESYEQIVVTCGAREGKEAQLLATVSGPPDSFRATLSNPDPISPAHVVSYQQVSSLGDLEPQRYELQPGEEWPVPLGTWALVSLDR